MLTFFSTPKPFAGHVDVIQRNALQSWKQVHPDVEILLFGDDAGAAEAASELQIRHIPDVRKNRHGTKYLANIYDQAQELARHDLLCHVNCDILFLDDFAPALSRVALLSESFLMAGRRWDVDVRKPLQFSNSRWRDDVRELARRTNRQRPPQWIDYFVFRRGLFQGQIPEFVIGRPGWDNWLLWFALHSEAKLIDASCGVCAVHQNHDYAYHPDGEKGVWEGEEAQENYKLLEANRKFRTLDNATHILKDDTLRRNYSAVFVQARREAYRRVSPVWFRVLDLTRPLRHRIGLRQKGSHSA
ncbi:MAG TPA: hypothetical protein VL128_15490 [Candidatus Eisenbacteria bacterium]|nr:hypothetical protein [Candidatus Eisenbacteria bacterium]